MEKIEFTSPETEERLSFFVLEKAELSGEEYLLVTEEETGDAEAYVLRKLPGSGDEAEYEFVEDEKILSAVAPLFEELLEEIKIES